MQTLVLERRFRPKPDYPVTALVVSSAAVPVHGPMSGAVCFRPIADFAGQEHAAKSGLLG